MSQIVTIFADGAHTSVEWRWKRNASDMWIAECPALAQVVQAESWSELLATIDEVQDSLMRVLYQDGELQSFLAKRGWKLMGALPMRASEHPIPRFEVPFELIHSSQGGRYGATA